VRFSGQERAPQSSTYFTERSPASDAERKRQAVASVTGKPIGQTALHLAADQCYSDVVKLLLDAGADKTGIDGDGKTALYYAQHAKISGDACKECIALLGGGTVKVSE
jgi:ankyrin repeat protein